MPQPPQLKSSVWRSTQESKHLVSGALQTQLLAMHVELAGHWVPQDPQFFESDVRSLQSGKWPGRPEQSVSGDGQVQTLPEVGSPHVVPLWQHQLSAPLPHGIEGGAHVHMP